MSVEKPHWDSYEILQDEKKLIIHKSKTDLTLAYPDQQKPRFITHEGLIFIEKEDGDIVSIGEHFGIHIALGCAWSRVRALEINTKMKNAAILSSSK